MSEGFVPCGEAGLYPPHGVQVVCIAKRGHNTRMHVSGPPHIVYWPVDPQVTCSAYKVMDTTMGEVVAHCALRPERHRPTRHETFTGVAMAVHTWSDADLNTAGKMARLVGEMMIRYGYVSGDMLPTLHSLAKEFKSSPRTVREGMDILARDGLIHQMGNRWVRT